MGLQEAGPPCVHCVHGTPKPLKPQTPETLKPQAPKALNPSNPKAPNHHAPKPRNLGAAAGFHSPRTTTSRPSLPSQLLLLQVWCTVAGLLCCMPVAPRPTSRTMSSRWLLLWCRLLGCASGCVCLEEATLLLRSVSWYHLFQETLLIKEGLLRSGS